MGCFRRFNAGLSGEPERTIVTSTGPFIVAWNFRQVKSGNINNYTLRRFSEEVVADNFKFGGDREIVSSGGSFHSAPDEQGYGLLGRVELRDPRANRLTCVVRSDRHLA